MDTDLTVSRTRTAEVMLHECITEKKPETGRNSQSDATISDTTRRAPEEDHEYITGLKLAAVIGSITLVAFLILLDTSIISTATPMITSDFHSLADVGWYAAAYQLASASLQPLTGKLYTHFSAKWMFIVFFFLFELGSLICGLANSSNMLIGGRAIAGMGSSGLMNGAMTVIAGAVPLHQRPLYTGIMMGFANLGLVMGPLIGGALTEYTTWRWCFYINLPLGAVAAVLLVFTRIPELTVKPPLSWSLVRNTIPELDLFGFILFAPASVMFLLALQFGGNSHPWNSAVVIGLFCGAGATAIIFGIWEFRMGDRAMIPGSVVKIRIVWSSVVQGMALMTTVYVSSQFLPIYFQGVKGDGPTMSGVSLLPSILSQLLFAVLSGILVSKLGYYLPWVVFSSALGAVSNGLASTISPTTPTARWVGFLILLGVGRGSGLQMGMIAVQNALPPEQIPTALAFLIFGQNFAASIFIVIATVIFTQSLVSEIAIHAPSVAPEAALAAGASSSAVRALVPVGSPELEGVLLALSNSVNKIFYLLVACSVVGFVAAFGMGWIDVRKKKVPGKGDA
ncbi:major facilitator superfamily domain-containing protein [Xylariales sp. AK1849]|nr:major facilitator superfamily domain-containing protein [Xylariales sp. AK1849]